MKTFTDVSNTVIQCPNCKQTGKMIFNSQFHLSQGVKCDACGHETPVLEGIVNFAEHIPVDKKDPNPAQRLMNTRAFAKIYETPIWRPLHTWIGSGISMHREVEEIIDFTDLKPPGLIADLACGTGHYARAFSRHFQDAGVLGVDISLGMLITGRKIAHEHKIPNLIFFRGDIYKLPFCAESLDLVNCAGALHLFPKVRPIWREIARVLKPGGMMTAMTIARTGGVLGKIQKKVMAKKRATFFELEPLAQDLRSFGLNAFSFRKHRTTLLFSTQKRE